MPIKSSAKITLQTISLQDKGQQVRAIFHLTISMLGQRATGKIQRIITITGVAGRL